MEKKELQARWSGQSFTIGWLRSALQDTPQGDFLDLRGLRVAEVIQNLTIGKADFSFTVFEGAGQINMCTVSDSLFREITLGTNLGRKFVNCDFAGSRFPGVLFRGEFTECKFDACNLTGAAGNEVKFTRCSFVGTTLSKVDFQRCQFIDCNFEAAKFIKPTLSGSKFTGVSESDLDLRNPYMPNVQFV